MADETDTEAAENPDDSGGEQASGGGMGRKIALAAVVLVGLGAGVGVGLSTLGPTVGPILAERAANAGSHGGGHGGEGGPDLIHLIDNVVVNPARSGGTRFLLMSIAVEVLAPELTESVAARDLEIRAAMTEVLGARSTEELSFEHLPSIKAEILQALEGIMGPDVISTIHISQFVIQ